MPNRERANGESKSPIAPGGGQVTWQLDQTPPLAFHYWLFGRVAIGLFFDIFDIYIASAVAGALVAGGWGTLQEIAPLASVTLAGMMIGSLSAGLVCDKWGRRLAFRWSLVIVCISSLVAALAPNLDVLVGARLITGIGLGAEVVLAYAAFAEFLPASVRGRWLGMMAMTGNTAVIVAAFAAYVIIPLVGWRWLFVIGAVGAAIGVVLRRDIPESPRWLELQGRHKDALAVLNRIGIVASRPLETVVSAAPSGAPPTAPRDYPLRSLFVASVVCAALYISIFGFLTWLPGIMVTEGRALKHSLLLNVFMSCGAVAGTVLGGYIADWTGRRPGIALLAVASGAFGVLYALSADDKLQTLLGFLLYTGIYALGVVSVSIYVPELFTTRVRMRGAGSAVSIGRLFAIGAPMVLPWLHTYYGLLGAAVAIAGVLTFEVMVVLLLGHETRAQPL